MKLTLGLTILCLCTAPWALAGDPPKIQADLQQQYAGKVVFLRDFYTDSSVAYDVDGKVLGNPTRGYGAVDGSVHVTKLTLTPDSLVIEGDTPIPVWSTDSQELSWIPSSWKRTITAKLRSADDAPGVLNLIFLRPNEHLDTCNATDRQRFIENAALRVKKAGKKDPKRSEDETRHATAVADLYRFCLPTGETAYEVGMGLLPPKPLHVPDPSFTQSASRKHLDGFEVASMIVDASGRATSIVLLGKPLPEGLAEEAWKTLRTWKFEPAKFQGDSLPVQIYVEFHFGWR